LRGALALVVTCSPCLAGAGVTGLVVLDALALAVNPHFWMWGPLAVQPGVAVALALLGVSALKTHSFGLSLRVVPLVAAGLGEASFVLALLVSASQETLEPAWWVCYWPLVLLSYHPFMGSALLGCALFAAALEGSREPMHPSA
jgi:hypothetical protein